jgi:toxin CptA
MGGVDLSWLAGGLSAAGAYAALGGTVHRRYSARNAAPASTAAPLTSATGPFVVAKSVGAEQ